MSESSGTWTQYQKLVLKLLEQHDEKLEALRQQLADSVNDRAAISENITSLKVDINFLLALVRDGSAGSVSILSRLDAFDHDIKALKQGEADRTVAQNTEANNIMAWKRALFIAIIGILLNVGWDVIQTLFIRK